MLTSSPPQSTRYDPQYDPLVAKSPGAGRDYAPTYWVASAGTPPQDDGPVNSDRDADVVVIGSRNPSITTHLLGSNASSVIRHTHIPVMVVR